MKRFLLLLGMGIGFVLGSKAGRAPYERLERTVREFRRRPQVRASLRSVSDTAAAVRDATLDAANGAIDEASRKITDESNAVGSKVASST